MKKIYLLLIVTCVALFANAQNGSSPSSAGSRGVEGTSPVANIARESQYDVKFYWLDLDLEAVNSNVSGNALTRAVVVATTGLDTFSLELDAVFTIDSATVQNNNGGFQTATVKRGAGNTEVDVLLPSHAATNDLVEVRVYYHGTANTSLFGQPSGPAYFIGPPNYSASPPYNSSTWWPCKQNLTDKADSSWFFITTDTSSKAVSNGVLTNTVSVSNTKTRFEWKSHHGIDFYLISFVVGHMDKDIKYFLPIGRTDSMPVEFYGIDSLKDKLKTLDVLQRLSEVFGPYPFYDEKFGLAAVNLGGGMENQTIVSLGAQGTVIEHETTHQWFGDNVTCGSYKDLWLNEGFARWGESLYPELASANHDSARISVCNQYENGNLSFGAYGGLHWPSGSVYYYNTDTVDILTLYGGQGRDMNYEKPAMMINSLRFETNNDSLFFLGLRNYQNNFAGKSATSNDFRDVMENTLGTDLTQFFNQWCFGYGFPQFNIRWNQENGVLSLAINEHPSDSAKTPLFQTSLEIKAKRVNLPDTIVRLFISENSSAFGIPCGDSVIGLVIDPNQWILNKAGSTVKDTSLVVAPLAVKNIENEENIFTVFPNPANDYLNIRSSLPTGTILEAELFNTIGQRLYYSKIYGNEPISLQGLPDGMYILQLNHTAAYKISVVH